MRQDCTLRPATNADCLAVERLVFDVLAEYGLAPEPDGVDTDLKNLEGFYREGCFSVLVDSSGAIVGSVGLVRTAPGHCELRKMYLAPSIRGQGWGRSLLQHSLARARELGFKRVTLETATVLREAVRLYESYGFKRFTPEHCAKRCDAAYYLDL